MNAKVNITLKEKKIELPQNTRKLIRKACDTVLVHEGFLDKAEINVILTNDDEIKQINREFRDIDNSTDVLSFPLGENGNYDINPETDCYMIGDIVISLEHAIYQADLYGHSFEREIAFLTVHSMLHLLGYDHVNSLEEEKEMFTIQEEILKLMGQGIEK